MLPATVDRHHGEQHMTARSKPEAASAADAPAHDQEESVVARIIEHIDGDAGDDEEEMMILDAGSPQPAKATRLIPATRSTLGSATSASSCRPTRL